MNTKLLHKKHFWTYFSWLNNAKSRAYKLSLAKRGQHDQTRLELQGTFINWIGAQRSRTGYQGEHCSRAHSIHQSHMLWGRFVHEAQTPGGQKSQVDQPGRTWSGKQHPVTRKMPWWSVPEPYFPEHFSSVQSSLGSCIPWDILPRGFKIPQMINPRSVRFLDYNVPKLILPK
jgi:hypothetical protein